MTITDIISNIEDINDDAVIYAKKADGKFTSSSEAIILNLPEEEMDVLITETAEKYCPGFDYFLEGFILREMAEDMRASTEYASIAQMVDRIIYYAEFDA
ncbi:MAG: hypothetical protein V4649_09230 [Bacteroidota bacterium]